MRKQRNRTLLEAKTVLSRYHQQTAGRIRLDGGVGSGNHHHPGRPGRVGGAGPGDPSPEGIRLAEEARRYDPSKVPAIKDYGETDTSWRRPGDSMSKYTGPDGKLTKEREQLHREIINKHFEGVKPAEGKPVYTLMGGGPASGKSTLRKSKLVPIEENSVAVDCDSVKDMLPEYQSMLLDGSKEAAKYCHSESSSLAERTRSVAMQMKYNVVDDGTGNGSARDIMEKIQKAHDVGMAVKGVYVTVPVEVALERARKRAEETGRVVPEEIIRRTHASVSRDLPECAAFFDELVICDMEGEPTIIATGGNGKPLAPVRGQEKKFAAFLAKGKP